MFRRLLSVSLVFCALSMLVACGPKEGSKDNSVEKETSTKAVEMKKIVIKDLTQEMQVIDIRQPDKFIGWKNDADISGHIKGAIDFPASWFEYEPNSEFIDIELKRRHIDKDKPTVLYADDAVAEADFNRFVKQGFKDLAVLDGGINAYVKEGGEVSALKGYTRYVSPEWVASLIEGKSPEGYKGQKYKIVEIAFDEKEYKRGHIPGALYQNTDEINHIPGPRTIEEYESVPMEKQLTFWGFPEDESIQSTIEKLGIDEDTMVILYATTEATTAANRAALVMDYAGVKDIRLINGGKPLWELEKRALDTKEETTEPATFKNPVPQNPSIVYDYKQELEMIDDADAVIASVRSWDEFLGKVSGYTYIADAGDIKNFRFAYAGSDPYSMEDYRNIDNTMFNYEYIQNRWDRWGIVQDKRISFHCGTGWRAAETYYIADAIGYEDKGVYVGGWYEWSKRGLATKAEGLPSDAPEKEPEQFFYKEK